jgi:hypothetical protein
LNSDAIGNYLDLTNQLDECVNVIRKEKAEESKRSEASGQLYNILINYVQKMKLAISIDRNLMQAKIISEKVDSSILFSNTKLKAE